VGSTYEEQTSHLVGQSTEHSQHQMATRSESNEVPDFRRTIDDHDKEVEKLETYGLKAGWTVQ
jgi:hypothetical protein